MRPGTQPGPPKEPECLHCTQPANTNTTGPDPRAQLLAHHFSCSRNLDFIGLRSHARQPHADVIELIVVAILDHQVAALARATLDLYLETESIR